jgi:hypothetical protein
VDISKDVFGKVEPSRRKRLLEWIHGPGRSRHPGQSPPPHLRPRPPGESRNKAAATTGWRGRRPAGDHPSRPTAGIQAADAGRRPRRMPRSG